jgi:hypothetical protein
VRGVKPYGFKRKESQMSTANELTTLNETAGSPKTGRSSRTYTKLVNEYKRFAKKSTENIINLAETLVRASSKLSTDDFNRFCNEVHLQKDGSTFRKLMRIGEKISRFEMFLDRLPNNWTTLYKLASLDEDKFKLVTGSDVFRPSMTGKQINLLIGASPRGKKTHPHDFVIDLGELDKERKLEVFRQLKLLKQEFGFELTASETLQEIADSLALAANDNVPNGTTSHKEAV